MIYSLNTDFRENAKKGLCDISNVKNSRSYLDVDYDIFFNSEINTFFPLNVLYFSEISSDCKKAFGNLFIKKNFNSLPKSRYIEYMNNPNYYESSPPSGKFSSLGIRYFFDNHILYQSNSTSDSMKFLYMLCIKSEYIQQLFYNDIEPYMFVLLVDQQVDGGLYKTCNSIVKKYKEDNIDIYYTHDILSNFNIISKEDILDRNQLCQKLDDCLGVKTKTEETIEKIEIEESDISQLDTYDIF